MKKEELLKKMFEGMEQACMKLCNSQERTDLRTFIIFG